MVGSFDDVCPCTLSLSSRPCIQRLSASNRLMHSIQASASTVEQPEKRYLEVLATLRTVFDLADSVFDGCQIWGPKAAFSTAAKGVKALQVR
jgi:hypothetical protein